MTSLTAERLRELLSYDPETGVLRWKVAPRSNRVRAGDEAGTIDSKGYREIRIDGGRCLAHRLAWCYAHGAWPANQIDHINGLKLDNRLSNLREATHAENQRNRAVNSHSKSGLRGVQWHSGKRKWRARIRREGKQIHLGYYDVAADAARAYAEAASRCHGAFFKAN